MQWQTAFLRAEKKGKPWRTTTQKRHGFPPEYAALRSVADCKSRQFLRAKTAKKHDLPPFPLLEVSFEMIFFSTFDKTFCFHLQKSSLSTKTRPWCFRRQMRRLLAMSPFDESAETSGKGAKGGMGEKRKVVVYKWTFGKHWQKNASEIFVRQRRRHEE